MSSHIQWFPGHMAKARRQVSEKLKLIDVVIELLDARLPTSSRNPMIFDIIANKPRLVLLNKADLADPQITRQWVSYLEAEGEQVLTVDSQSGKGIGQIAPKCKHIVQDMLDKRVRKGMAQRAVRALIVGIPNVGKSSLINRLAKKSVAKTGDRPGITKAQQWIKAGDDFELLDTPGILWPKFDDQQVGLRLAASGAIKDEILDVAEVAFYVIKWMKEAYPQRLTERFNLELLDPDPVQIMEAIGRRRGCLMAGGHIDFDKVSELILRELRSGKLGNISFEQPDKP